MNFSKEVRFEIVGNSYHVYLTSKGSSTVFFDIVFVRFILSHIRRRGATHAAIQASIAKLQTMKCSQITIVVFRPNPIRRFIIFFFSREKTVPMTESEDKGREHVLYAKM